MNLLWLKFHQPAFKLITNHRRALYLNVCVLCLYLCKFVNEMQDIWWNCKHLIIFRWKSNQLYLHVFKVNEFRICRRWDYVLMIEKKKKQKTKYEQKTIQRKKTITTEKKVKSKCLFV